MSIAFEDVFNLLFETAYSIAVELFLRIPVYLEILKEMKKKRDTAIFYYIINVERKKKKMKINRARNVDKTISSCIHTTLCFVERDFFAVVHKVPNKQLKK